MQTADPRPRRGRTIGDREVSNGSGLPQSVVFGHESSDCPAPPHAPGPAENAKDAAYSRRARSGGWRVETEIVSGVLPLFDTFLPGEPSGYADLARGSVTVPSAWARPGSYAVWLGEVKWGR